MNAVSSVKPPLHDCLYNIRHNTKHQYINLGRLRTRHGVNITRTPWVEVSSLPIPDTTYPKKEPMSPPRIRHCRLPHSPKHPGTDSGEDPHHQKLCKCTFDHVHKVLFPPRDEVEHDTPIEHPLIGAYRYDTCMHLCPYSLCRRYHEVGRGQPLTYPSPDTVSHICSPFPDLVVSCPSPFKFSQDPCFLFFNPVQFCIGMRVYLVDRGLDPTLYRQGILAYRYRTKRRNRIGQKLVEF
jgi:hypothetical protein